MHYNIKPSLSVQSSGGQCSNEASVDDYLTLPHFIDSSSDYLKNDTSLTFLPGNYILELELTVENVHSFSMTAWPSRTDFTCLRNARLEFKNISLLTVSGFRFIGCFENRVFSIGHFQLHNSKFSGNGQATVNGTVLMIEDSVANLDRVVFISALEKLQTTATPQKLLEDCNAGTIETMDAVIGISLKQSTIEISQSQFEGNNVGLGAVIYDESGSDILIFNTIFVNNSASQYCNDYCCFAGSILFISKQYRSTVKLYHSKFEKNVGVAILSHGDTMHTSMISIIHSEFVANTITDARNYFSGIFIGSSLVSLDATTISLNLNKFVDNTVGYAIVYIPYDTTAENLTNNVFTGNSAAYEVFIGTTCRPDLSLSLGSSRCIQCTENWQHDLMGVAVAAFIAGIALVFLMLSLNMTFAIGTLNGIFFYAHVIGTNVDTYFWPITAPDFVTVFISWINLDIGFDICFSVSAFAEVVDVYKALIQLVFPTYVIFLVIIVIVASEYSPKFAKMVGKGNPVAVLATMILLSYAKFLNAIFASLSLLYWKPAYGSQTVDTARSGSVHVIIEEANDTTEFIAISYILILINVLVLFVGIMYCALLFFWQWLPRYQDKVIFKWVKYQKLRHFLEPYHAPYVGKYRYWTGLLLFVRFLLYLISLLNFSLNPRVNLISVIFFIGGLIVLKCVISRRIYNFWLLDTMESAIYFNLIAFSALTWYNLDFGGNQIAVAYISVMIIFILLIAVIIFHFLRYTMLYKYSFVEKALRWISSKLLEERSKELDPSNSPEELDGYQLERNVAGDQELPTVTHSVVEISHQDEN